MSFFFNNFLELVDLAGPPFSSAVGGLKGELGGLFAFNFNYFIIFREKPFPYSPSLRGSISYGVGTPNETLSAALGSGNASYQLCWAALNYGLILSGAGCLLDAECPWLLLKMPGLKTGTLFSRDVSTPWNVEAVDVEFLNWGCGVPWTSPFPWPPTVCGKHQFSPSLKVAGCLAEEWQGQMQSHI